MLGEPLKERGEVAASELPFEGMGSGLVVILEAEQRVVEFVERGEVARRKELALDDREVDLDLVEPTGMDGQMYCDGVVIGVFEPLGEGGGVVGGAIVDDPEDAISGRIWFLGHHPVHQFAEGEDPGSLIYTPKDVTGLDIQRSQIRHRISRERLSIPRKRGLEKT